MMTEITNKRIFSPEEIEGLRSLYLVNEVKAVKQNINLKNVFQFWPDKKEMTHYVKKLSSVGDPIHMYFVEYTAGAFATKHSDAIEGYTKTLTTITHLNDLDDYEGGESILGDKTYKVSKGSTIIFDGKEKHGVKKVISGSRLVFVVWYGIE
jgi:hypothetical protein